MCSLSYWSITQAVSIAPIRLPLLPSLFSKCGSLQWHPPGKCPRAGMCRLFATAVPSLLRGPIVVKSNFFFHSTVATHQKFSFFWHLTQAQIPPTLSQHMCVRVRVCAVWIVCVCVCFVRRTVPDQCVSLGGRHSWRCIYMVRLLLLAVPFSGRIRLGSMCVCVCVSSIHRFNFLTDEIKYIRSLFLRMRLHLCLS